MLVQKNLESLFDLKDVNCLDETKAYIHSIYKKQMHATNDLSKESVTLYFIKAKESQNFNLFQNLADWLFFCETFFPEYLQDASKNYYHSIAQSSYYSCYKLINKKWKLFQEMSESFQELVSTLEVKVKKKSALRYPLLTIKL